AAWLCVWPLRPHSVVGMHRLPEQPSLLEAILPQPAPTSTATPAAVLAPVASRLRAALVPAHTASASPGSLAPTRHEKFHTAHSGTQPADLEPDRPGGEYALLHERVLPVPR